MATLVILDYDADRNRAKKSRKNDRMQREIAFDRFNGTT
jgi:hypothetical protein